MEVGSDRFKTFVVYLLRMPLTAEQRKKVGELFAIGRTPFEISKETDLPYKSVYRQNPDVKRKEMVYKKRENRNRQTNERYVKEILKNYEVLEPSVEPGELEIEAALAISTYRALFTENFTFEDVGELLAIDRKVVASYLGYIPAAEAAKQLGVSREKIRQYMHDGRLPWIKQVPWAYVLRSSVELMKQHE